MNNLKIVTQIEEVSNIGDPNCKMIEPYVVGEQDSITMELLIAQIKRVYDIIR